MQFYSKKLMQGGHRMNRAQPFILQRAALR